LRRRSCGDHGVKGGEKEITPFAGSTKKREGVQPAFDKGRRVPSSDTVKKIVGGGKCIIKSRMGGALLFTARRGKEVTREVEKGTGFGAKKFWQTR